MPWRVVPTGAELDPAALLTATLTAADAALGHVEGRIAGVGVAGLAETGVLLDARGEPVVPAIAWYDWRESGEAERLERDLGGDAFARRTGLPCGRCARWSSTPGCARTGPSPSAVCAG